VPPAACILLGHSIPPVASYSAGQQEENEEQQEADEAEEAPPLTEHDIVQLRAGLTQVPSRAWFYVLWKPSCH